eukprot:2560393-Pyramimonas_sp.AAC.1
MSVSFSSLSGTPSGLLDASYDLQRASWGGRLGFSARVVRTSRQLHFVPGARRRIFPSPVATPT